MKFGGLETMSLNKLAMNFMNLLSCSFNDDITI